MIFLGKGEGGLMEESYVGCGQIRTVDKDLKIDLNAWIIGQIKVT